MRVYAGKDVLTGKEYYLGEVIKPGPHAQDLAEDAKRRWTDDVQAGRHVKTTASLVQIIEEHLKHAELEESSKDSYRANLRKHIEPQFRSGPAAEVTTHTIEKFKAELRRCRDHCDGRPRVDHRKPGEHGCTTKCKPHVCRPLSKWTVRKNLFLISVAYESAIVWEWLFHNPVENARVPAAPQPNPRPPTAEQAARIMNAAWRVEGYLGPLVWLAMMLGPRRGELCGLRWHHLQARHLAPGEHDCVAAHCEWWLSVEISRAQTESGEFDKDTKTHQTRRVALDLETVAVLTDYRNGCATIAAAAGTTLREDGYMFTSSVDGLLPLKPRTVSQRYKRLTTKLGITTCIKMLRHFSATELLTAGVDLRTVAGRLGHGGGGTTTLKVYAAWVSAADQRAALTMLDRMPARRTAVISSAGLPADDPDAPHREYELIAGQLRDSILDGTLPAGTEVPTVKELAALHTTTIYQAHQALQLLKSWGLLTGGGRGQRPTVVHPDPRTGPDQQPVHNPDQQTVHDPVHDPVQGRTSGPVQVPASGPVREAGRHTEQTTRTGPVQQTPLAGAEALDLELRHLGQPVRTYQTHADPTNAAGLLRLLRDAIRRTGGTAAEAGDYELVVRYTGERGVVTTVVAPPQLTDGLVGVA